MLDAPLVSVLGRPNWQKGTIFLSAVEPFFDHILVGSGTNPMCVTFEKHVMGEMPCNLHQDNLFDCPEFDLGCQT